MDRSSLCCWGRFRRNCEKFLLNMDPMLIFEPKFLIFDFLFSFFLFFIVTFFTCWFVGIVLGGWGENGGRDGRERRGFGVVLFFCNLFFSFLIFFCVRTVKNSPWCCKKIRTIVWIDHPIERYLFYFFSLVFFVDIFFFFFLSIFLIFFWL